MTSTDPTTESDPDTRVASLRRGLVGALLVFAGIVLLRTAWITDDAAITFRVVENWLHGHGPRFNPDERVQAYTHPLWFLLLSGTTALFRSVWASAMILAGGCTLAVVGLVAARGARIPWVAALGAVTLLFSKAFVDFATSGLENPLVHLLLVGLVLAASEAIVRGDERARLVVAACAGLLPIVRGDAALLALPPLAVVAWGARDRPKTLAVVTMLAALPLLAWTAFALVYYGFPFPNTAYAKLGTGIAAKAKLVQGIRYLLDSAGRDPTTLGVIGAAALAALGADALGVSLAMGSLAYVAYVVVIGGDFMSGRFFTAPFVAALLALLRAAHTRERALVGAALVAALASASLPSTLWSGRFYEEQRIGPDGIADERGFYFHDFALTNARRETFQRRAWEPGPREVRVLCGLLGYKGMDLGPSTHLIDECGLADPLLARLPAKPDPNWRVGHFVRELPPGYRESIESGENLVQDPAMHAYYDAIRLVTRGPLFDRARLRMIVDLNLGRVRPPEPASAAP